MTHRRAQWDAEGLRRDTYTITIRDTSRSHNFTLYKRTNPGNRSGTKILTSFAFVGTKTVTVTLKPGVYSYSCSCHSIQGMHDSFTVA